jgi:SAM-dependent methyltransferase
MFDRQNFWRDPAETEWGSKIIHCNPEFYLDLVNVSTLIVDVMNRYAKKTWGILEIGCGTGRNLVALKQAGFKNVRGIEISQKAIDIGREAFPEYASINVICAPVEDVIRDIKPVSVIFTQGCLMHIPWELDWILDEIASKARKLILTNEGELKRHKTIHAWPRDYQVEFEKRGWSQAEWEMADKYPPLPPTTIKRVFVK